MQEEKLLLVPKGYEVIGDIARTYFTGKLYFERSRIAGEVKDDEDILVLFCGVGPFLIPIAKRKKVNIIGLEKNPFACDLFRKNAVLNLIDADIILGDANSMNDLFKKDFEIEHFKKLLEEKGWQIDYYRKCGDVAPRVGRYVFDIFFL